MKMKFSVWLLLWVSYLCWAESPSPIVSTPPVSQSPTASTVITPAESSSLLSEFIKAQKVEIKALEHRQKFELKELDASHSAQLREWEKKEKDARHRYFLEHTNGPERRTYVQDFMQRGKSLRKQFADERAERLNQQKSQWVQLSQEQVIKYNDFKKSLSGGLRPPASLWPSSH